MCQEENIVAIAIVSVCALSYTMYCLSFLVNAMETNMQAMEVVCKHFIQECGSAEISKLRKEKGKAHQKTFALRQGNANLRYDCFNAKQQIRHMQRTIDNHKIQYAEYKHLVYTLLSNMEKRR